MNGFHQRAIKVPRGTHLRHLTLKPHASDGTTKKVTVHKGSEEVGHFMLSDKQNLSDFSWTLHHRQLFLQLKQPVHSAAPPKVHGLRGWVSAAAASVCSIFSMFVWTVSLLTLIVRFGTTFVIKQEPAAAMWAELGAHAPGFFGSMSWEEWRQADAFHLLYDWLLVLLQERLLSSQGTLAGSVYIAWNQMLWVAALTFLLSLTSAARLVWLSFTSGRRQEPLAAKRQATQPRRHADAAPSTPTGTEGLHEKEPFAGSTSGPDQDLIPANAMPSSAAHSEEDSRQAKLAKMRKALEEAGVDTVSRADAHATHVEAENKALRLQVSSLTAQLTAAQQSSAFFRRLFFAQSRKRVAAEKRIKATLQQAAAQTLNTAVPEQESVDTLDNNTSNTSATAEADTSTTSSAKSLTETNASTAVAGTSTAATSTETAPAGATEVALSRAVSIAHKLRLSAESRVSELASANASLQGILKKVSADLQQAETKIDKQDTKFFQADKMRQRAEEDLSGVAAERNRLLRLVSGLPPEQVQANRLPSTTDQETKTNEEMPNTDFQQASPCEEQGTPDQTYPLTPAKTRPQASAYADTAQLHTLEQTDKNDAQIPAIHAGLGQLQELQQELENQQEVIERQAADITHAAVKMSAQQGVVQQLRADLRARELPALLFHVRLVPTRGFKDDQFDLPHSAKLLGEGGSATIYQESLSGELRATKYPKKGVKAVSALAHELCMHLRCAGPNTVSILSVGMDKIPRGPMLSANVICFSMEVASMSLKAYIAQATGGFKGSNREGLVFSLDTTKRILRQVLAAIQGVHRTHTLHGDIKPDNFLVFCQGDHMSGVKITDFGLSQTLVNGSHEIIPTADGARGTPGWIAPEMFVQNLLTTQKLKSTVSAAADVYAAGWVFFEVLCGLSPLLFQDAKTDDDFAAGAASVKPLDSKIRRQEVSLDLDDSSDSSMNSMSSSATSSLAPTNDGEEGQDGRSNSCHSMPGSVDDSGEAAGAAAVHDDLANDTGISADKDGNQDALCSTNQALEEAHPADDADMVHVYPEYLLSGTGLKLLELCMAMWARDPRARPSCGDIVERLAEL